jgi:hypothetical protein
MDPDDGSIAQGDVDCTAAVEEQPRGTVDHV